MAPTLYASANATWLQWTGTTTSTQVSVRDIWDFWNQTQTGTASTIWQAWNSTSSGGPVVLPTVPAREVSPEEQERLRVRAAERTRMFNEAKARARTLLLDVLDQKQRAEFARHGSFTVETKDGTRLYRLRPNSAPVRIKGEDGSQWSYCIHPEDSRYPAEDVTAALKLLLESDEERFLQIANASRVSGGASVYR